MSTSDVDSAPDCAACGKALNRRDGYHSSRGMVCRECHEQAEVRFERKTSGDFVLGLMIGGFGGCIALVLTLILAKGEKTKQGAWVGAVIHIVLNALVVLARALG